MPFLRSRRLAAALLLALAAAPAANAAELTVSAAASLTNAFKALAPLFEAANPGDKVNFNFAAANFATKNVGNNKLITVTGMVASLWALRSFSTTLPVRMPTFFVTGE